MRLRKPQVIFLILVVIAGVVFFILTGIRSRVAPRRVPSAAGRQNVSVSGPQGRSAAEHTDEMKDLRCTIVGISYNKTNPMVVIENNAYVPGDSVCGGIIIGINRERVTVLFQKTEKIFVIGDKIAE